MLVHNRCLGVVLAGCAQVELLTHRRSVVRTEDKAAVAKTNRTIYSIGPILDGVSTVLWLERRRTALKLKYVSGLVHTCSYFEHTAVQKPP